MKYNLETEKIINTIKKKKAKLVCLQLPEGLKPEALNLADEIKKKTDAQCLIWLGSCYGACDLPEIDVDLIIQFGHSAWPYKNKNIKIIK